MDSLETKCLQAGYKPKNGEARIAPIVQSTTFQYTTPEEMGDLFDLKVSGYFYSRLGNPTCGVLEEKVTALEGGAAGLACASGMSAITIACLTLLGAGDNIVSSSTLYGGTYNLFNYTFRKFGIDTKFFCATSKESDIEALIDDKTKIFYVETLANPAMNIADLDLYAKICAKHKVIFMVDNTLTTPFICRPLEHGANIIIHSTTKYLDGHATSVGGLIIDGGNFDFNGNKRYEEFNNPDTSYHGLVYAKDCGNTGFITKARVQIMRDVGAQMAPMNAFLTNLGTETLHLRMERISANALAVAKMLKNHKMVDWVSYAGLVGDSNHALAKKYFDNMFCSGMVVFGVKGGRENAFNFQKNLKMVAIVTHIADVRSSVLHPASTTHRQLSDEGLIAAGISAELIRLSIGIEGEADIVNDIKNALDMLDK